MSDLAPNVPILRRLKTQFGEFLGAPWQGTHHTKVDTSDQIKKVQLKMKQFQLHLPVKNGRRATEREAVDILQAGAEKLQTTGLKTWTKSYKKWCYGR